MDPHDCVCVCVCVCVCGGGGGGGGTNSYGGEFILFVKTHFYGRALTSHFMREHSPPISILPILVPYSIRHQNRKYRYRRWGCPDITGIKASTLIPRQNGRHFAVSNVLILIQITLNFLQYGGLISVGTGNGLAPNMQQGMTRPKSFNSLRPRDLYMRQYTKPLLLQLMANHLLSGKPLSNAMLAYC